MTTKRILYLVVGMVVLVMLPFLVLNFGGGDEADQSQNRPPPKVSVLTVQPETVTLTSELPGRIAPLQVAEVRPKVSGVVLKRVFEQGSTVKIGDVLYRIDPEPFRARLASATAAVKRAEAALAQARDKADRISELRKRRVASAQDYDDAISALNQAEATVAGAKADAEVARIDLENTDVKAPISGRIGRAIVTEGALVSSADGQPMATINQTNTVYVDFTQTAGELMKLRQALRNGVIRDGAEEAKVTIAFDDGTPYPHEGKLLFSEVEVNAGTGQVTLRAELPNPDGDLLPGLYVRGKVEQGEVEAIAVPQQAVQRDTAGKAQVFVVTGESAAQLRPVELARAIENRWIVRSGLNAGDRIVVEGFQKIRPGATVVAEDWVPNAQRADAGSDSTAR